MNHKLYNWIGSILIFGIWLSLAISAIKAFMQLIIVKNEISDRQDHKYLDALNKLKRKARRMFLIWFATAILYIILSMIIDKTIGFKN